MPWTIGSPAGPHILQNIFPCSAKVFTICSYPSSPCGSSCIGILSQRNHDTKEYVNSNLPAQAKGPEPHDKTPALFLCPSCRVAENTSSRNSRTSTSYKLPGISALGIPLNRGNRRCLYY